jgi:hypothetical protein
MRKVIKDMFGDIPTDIAALVFQGSN